MAQYEHRDANNEWHPFSHMENEKIERAYRANGCRVHLTMPLNPAGFREFEIRFGDSARSKKMPRPPSTKMIQVNVASGATRVVRRVGPIDQPTMAPTLQYHGPATKRVVPIDQPTMGPTLQNNDPASKRVVPIDQPTMGPTYHSIFFEGGPYCWECCNGPCWCVCLCGPLTLEEKAERAGRRSAGRWGQSYNY